MWYNRGMKKIILSLFSLLFLFALIQKASANVIQGNASSTVDVETNIGGSGSVTTHVETDVNGKTQIFDTNKPGTYHIENNGSTSSAIKVSPTPTITPQPHKAEPANYFASIWTRIESALKNIFKVF